MPPEQLQRACCREFSADPTQWWDTCWGKPTLQQSEFEHDRCETALWADSTNEPACRKLQPGTSHLELKRTPDSARRQGAFAALAECADTGACRISFDGGGTVDAVAALTQLVERGCQVPNNLLYRVLKRCIANKNLVLGRRIHALIVKSGYEGDAFLATHLIGLYASFERLEEALEVFSNVSTPSAHNWATVIFACARHGKPAQAIGLYRQMCKSTCEPDNHVYLAVLKACAAAGDLVTGKKVHSEILASSMKPDIFVQNSLLDMYAKCKSLADAHRFFERLQEKDVVTWTTMIAGYAQQGMGQKALCLYRSMHQEGLLPTESAAFTCLLQACATIGEAALHDGKQLHAQIQEQGLQNDVIVGCSLVNMYAKCGSLEDARLIFDRLPDRNVVTWTTMIASYAQQGMGHDALSLYSKMLNQGYSQQGMGHEALILYNRMHQEGLSPPDSVTYTCLLQACASIGVEALHEGKRLHVQIEDQGLQCDVLLSGSLINMYMKCGCLEDARAVFDRLSDRNVVTWTAMIAGYAQQGMGQEALILYNCMQQEACSPPNSVTFVCLLQACAVVAGLPLGRRLHADLEEQGMQDDVVVGAALVNMYAKCGSMLDSKQVFDSLSERSIEAWNALIGGYTCQGKDQVVFDLFDKLRLEGREPNNVTFLSLLTVCSHVGLVDKGLEYFEVMRTDYGISPTEEHSTCMMDLLGRAGFLDEALEIAKTMPSPTNAAAWLTLLAACQKWTNVHVGVHAFKFAVSIEAKDSAPYILMSNIYARAGMWHEAEEMQRMRVQSGAWKEPGQCWTDVGGVLHTFAVGDKTCFDSEDLYARLEQLVRTARKEGRVPEDVLQLLK